MSNVTPGLICGHHHLYSSLARGMPPPPARPTGFVVAFELGADSSRIVVLLLGLLTDLLG
jgi:hypothetical protein